MALSIDHVVSLVADADSIDVVAVDPTVDRDAVVVDQSVALFAEAAVGLGVEIAVGWAGQWGQALSFIQDVAGVGTFALSILVALTLRASSNTLICNPVHVISAETYAFFRGSIVLTVGRARYGAGIGVGIIDTTNGAGSANSIDEVVGGSAFTEIVEGVDLGTGAAVDTFAVFDSVSLYTNTLSS